MTISSTPATFGGNSIHQHAAGISGGAAGNVDTHTGKSTNNATHFAAVGRGPLFGAGQQLFIIVPNICRGVFHRPDQLGVTGTVGSLQLLRRDLIGLGTVKFQ